MGKQEECFIYPQQPHTFQNDGDLQFIKRAIDFFRSSLNWKKSNGHWLINVTFPFFGNFALCFSYMEWHKSFGLLNKEKEYDLIELKFIPVPEMEFILII